MGQEKKEAEFQRNNLLWKLKIEALSNVFALSILLEIHDDELSKLMANTPHGQIYGIYANDMQCFQNMRDAISRMLMNDFINDIDYKNDRLNNDKEITKNIHERLRNLYK